MNNSIASTTSTVLTKLNRVPPAVLLSLGFVLGVFITGNEIWQLSWWMLVLLCFLLAAPLIILKPRYVWLAVAIMCIGLGAWRYFDEIGRWDEIRHPAWQFGRHEIVAEVISEPERYANKTSCDLRIGVLDGSAVDFTARLSIYDSELNEGDEESSNQIYFQYGDIISAFTRLYPPRRQSNPFGFDYYNYLTARKLGFVASTYPDDTLVVLDRNHGNKVLEAAFSLRRAFSAFLDENIPAEDAQLAKSIFLGMREAVSDENEEYFRKAGVMHILVVSGQNLTMIAFLIFTLLGLTGLHRRWAALCTVPFIIFYALLTGSDPPVVRACIMATIVLLGLSLGKKPPLGNAIGVTALLVLLVSPLMLFDPSFVLSFSATIGIALFMPFFKRILGFLPGFLRTIFAATLGAQVAVYPFIAFYFFRLASYSVPANLIIVPLSDLFMLMVGILILLGYLIPMMAGLAGQLVGWVGSSLTVTANFIAGLPASDVLVGRPSPFFIVVFFIGISALIYLQGKWRIWSVGVCTAALMLTLSAPAIISWLHPRAEGIFLDIGQGDSSVLISAQNTVWVIDTGDKYSRKCAAEYSLIPYLKGRAITRIDYLVLSHGHKDHTGGVFAVMDEFDVGTVVLPAAANCEETPWWMILAKCREKQVDVKFVGAEGWKTTNAAEEITVVEPYPEAKLPDKEERENMQSLAVIYRLKSVQVLWTGDLERAGMLRLIRMLERHPVIVKAPHHGSDDSGWEWIRELGPGLVVSQSSAAARKVADDEMQDWLNDAEIPNPITGKDGALEWNTDGVDLYASTFLSGEHWERRTSRTGF